VNIGKKYGYLWITAILFLGSISAHWTFAWFSYLDEQKDLNKPVELSGYFNLTMRDTMENWQSEFLQLIWQVGGLSFLWYVGSPSSKEGDERKEELMQEILRQVNPKDADRIISELAKKYPKK
jgi:hypothetical protein